MIFPHTQNFDREEVQKEQWRVAEKIIKELQATLPGGGPPTGAASGDLTGSYPGPTIANNAITSAKIADGTIANADINAAAAIDATKLGTGSVDNTELGYLDGVTSAIQTQLNAAATDTDLANHEADTTSVHGIADTSVLATDSDVSSAVSTHDAASTVHAAASNLIKTTGAQSKAGDFTLTNRLLHQNGSASAPAIAPSSDTDNGLYRVGANTLGISAAGSEVARASSTEFRVAADRVLRGTTLRVTQTIRYDTTAIPEMSGYAGAVIGDAMDATQTTIVIEELDAPPSGTTYPCAAVIDEGNAGEEWVIVHARDSGAEYTIQRGYPIGSGTGTTHSYGDTFRLVGDGSMQDANGNPDCHNFVISDIATTICFFSNALDPASGPQTIDLWLPPRLSVGAWAAPSDGKEFKFQFRDFTDHTIRFRDPVSGSIDELITGTGGGAITILYSQTAARYQAESSYT